MDSPVPHRPLARSLVLAATIGCAALAPQADSVRAQDATITATWRGAEVTVDGSIRDWTSLARVDAGPAVAVQNDGAALYIAVASNDPTLRVQLATGAIVWIDPSGRRRQTFGLRLEGLAPRPIAGAASTAATNDLSDSVLNPLEAFDLLGPARLQRRLIDDAGAVGIALASGVEDGTIVYELKVPLEKTDTTPHAVGARPGTTVSVGIETPTDPRPARGTRNRLDDPTNTNPWLDPWGYGGYFSTPPPPPGGRPRTREDEFKPMKLLWATVRLATAP
jgi:hypothetical protein